MIDLLHHLTPFLTGMAAVAYRPGNQQEGDAALIALCREFTHLNQETDRLGKIQSHMITDCPAWQEANAEIAPMVDRIHALRDEISDIPAITTDGLLAKARVALKDLVPFEQWPHNNEAWMAISVLEDLLGRDGK